MPSHCTFRLLLLLLLVLRQVWQSQAQRDESTCLRRRQEDEQRARILNKKASGLQGRYFSSRQCLEATPEAIMASIDSLNYLPGCT